MGGVIEVGPAPEDTTTGYPVLVVPGYGGPAFQTELVARNLRSSGFSTISLKLPWMAMGDMTRSAGVLAEQVDRLRDILGHEKVNIFGYSLGGLVARYYLQEMDGYPMLGRGAFVSTPNRGTYIGYLGFFSAAGRQVRPGSPFIRAINESTACELLAGRCLSMFVRWDGVIVPTLSSYVPFGYNLLLDRPILHWRATTSAAVIRLASEFLAGGLPDGALQGKELGMLEAGELVPVTLSMERAPGRRFWQAFSRPFRSVGGFFASIFRR